MAASVSQTTQLNKNKLKGCLCKKNGILKC